MNNNTVRRLKQKMKVHFTNSGCGTEENSTNYLSEVTCERCLASLKRNVGWEPGKNDQGKIKANNLGMRELKLKDRMVTNAEAHQR
jgi:hypothetical protein